MMALQWKAGPQIDIQADFEEPKVPAIIRNDDGTQRDDGLLPVTALVTDLEVIVPDWGGDPALTHYLHIGWRRAGAPFVSVRRFEYDPPIPPGDKTVDVPRDKLVHGVYELSYIIEAGGNPDDESLKRLVTVDTEAPNYNQQPGMIIFPAELNGVITEDYLSAEGQVRVQITRYGGIAAKDRAFYYWTDQEIPPDPDPDGFIGEQEFSQEDIDTNQLFITYDETDIRQAGGGTRYAYYRLRDLAGNTGPRSAVSAIQVDLTPAPGNLQPPRIPLSTRGLIDREHAREGATNQRGVTVEIDHYDNSNDTQKIVVNWDGTDLDEHIVDPMQWPQVIYVPWRTLTDKGLGPLTVQVDYRVRSGQQWTLPSPSTSTPADFTIAGQDHANAPALLNTTLARIEVRGPVSGLLNQLTGLDEGLPAPATLELYDDPQPSERIEVYWGSVVNPVDFYIVQPGDLAGKIIPFTIPWEAIEQDKNNPALPVYYTTDNGVNQQVSRVTQVNVSIVVIENLKEPGFPHASCEPETYGYLHCCSVPRLWEGVTVSIEGNVNFDAGDTVILTWQGCYNLNGTDPIPGVTDEFPKVLTADEAKNGFEIVVLPYDTLIAPMVNNNSGLAYYRLEKVSGAVGRSRRDYVSINRTMPSGAVCSPDNDICPET
ncbi:hypothetical protein UG46_16525 [Pseudomonas fluorescens]|uniref:hypothetical protein n=1 Tax=Pseudomonas fluorescens TaxID=294 RepID=UPI0005E7516D|nr:hypothetical protein [Pseudomonas fluorescens]KJH85328.1 hypothetical protein UG46_16525 [Pseudomonas fluorescens]